MPDDPSEAAQGTPAEPIAAIAEAGLNVIGGDLPLPKSVPSDTKETKELFGSEQRRQERIKRVFHWAFVVLLVVAAAVFILVFVVRALHFILPDNTAENAGHYPHCWLDERQLQSIDKFFFSGALGALISRYLGSALPKHDPPSK